jgi:hypothetical protein
MAENPGIGGEAIVSPLRLISSITGAFLNTRDRDYFQLHSIELTG